MQSPGVKQHGVPPPGAMPRNIQYFVLAGIALVVILATFWSGGGTKPKKPEEHAPQTAATPGQLQIYQQMLERQRREADQDAELHRARLLQEQAQPAPAMAGVPVAAAPLTAPADPVEEQIRKRAAAAPFASSYAVRVEGTEAPAGQKQKDTGMDDKTEIDRTSQIVVIDEASSATARSAEVKPPATTVSKESGRRLPPQEGELFRLFEGTMVRAALLNRLEGAFTGPVTCVVSAPVFAQNETTLLIPKGSRFIGKATRVEAENQTRLAVTFSRLILGNGYSITLDAAPGLDSAGEMGLKGKVDNHDLRRIGMAGAVGLLGGLALYGGQATPYAAGFANSTGNSATNILNHYLNVLPTITIPEGHPVNIYLPADLLIPGYRP
jgi:type IV secretion system protein VirB10